MTLKMFSILFVLFSAFFCVSVTTAQSICGTTSRNASIFPIKYLTSPYYPSDYPSSTTCNWFITAPSGYRVELSFVTFDTEGYYRSGSCSSHSDILEVYDGSYHSSSILLGKYCNNYLPANVYSSGISLYLRFTSDISSQRKGFKIKYKAVKPKPDSSTCSPFNNYSQNNNIQLSGLSGYIESPLYGTKYPSNMQCTWVITVPEGKKIKLTFSDFMVGNEDFYNDCTLYYSLDDKLQIRDGQYSYSYYLKTLCGNSLPSPVFSSGRYLWIRFKSNSDNYNTRDPTGFKAKYETVSSCGTKYRNVSLSHTSDLTSPYYPSDYPSSTTCEWIITVPSGFRMELSFVTFNTEGYYNSSGSCSSSSDILEVYDGSYNSSSKLRGKYCSNYRPAKLYSSGTSLYLRFISDSVSQRKGFNIIYKAVKPKPDSSTCSPFNTYSQNNNIQVSGLSGYIKSPLYGTKYPSNMQCTWVITVPEGKKIKLTFLDFSIGHKFSICSERHVYVEIRNGQSDTSERIGQYCSSSKLSPIHSSGRHLWIRFKSYSDNDLDENGKKPNGFRAKYHADDNNHKKDIKKSIKKSDAVGAIIIGIVIAAFVVTIIILVVFLRRRRRLSNRAQMRQPITQPSAPSYATVHYSPTPQSSYPPPSNGPSPQVSYQHLPPGSTGDAVYTPQPSAPINDHPSSTFLSDPPPAYHEVVPDVHPPPYPGISPNPSHIPTTQHPATS